MPGTGQCAAANTLCSQCLLERCAAQALQAGVTSATEKAPESSREPSLHLGCPVASGEWVGRMNPVPSARGPCPSSTTVLRSSCPWFFSHTSSLFSRQKIKDGVPNGK